MTRQPEQVRARGSALTAMLTLLGVCLLLVGLGNSTAIVARADTGVPPDQHTLGLVYAGLELARDGSCQGLFRLTAAAGVRAICTHGPDAAPASMNVAYSAAPATGTSSATAASVVCDGDGVTGKRVQVMYVHAADVPDQYAKYVSSIQRWAAGADAAFQDSAAETGGTRHVRFVTDANCLPTVLDVTLSPTGDDSFDKTVSEMPALGYNRTDRDYLLFVDAHVYCGISTTEMDDQPGSRNASNNGQHYSRVDAGCWNEVIAAHELMHAFGGVQLSAPHSSGDLHCTDRSDVMCYPSNGTPTKYICSDTPYVRFDCNHDDYFHTNPPPGSYLATHWDAAMVQFLISAPLLRVDGITTSTIRSKETASKAFFEPMKTVLAHVHLVDQYGSNVGGAAVVFAMGRQNNRPQCTISARSDALGNADGSCQVSTLDYSLYGTWSVRVNRVTFNGYPLDAGTSSLDQTFLLN